MATFKCETDSGQRAVDEDGDGDDNDDDDKFCYSSC